MLEWEYLEHQKQIEQLIRMVREEGNKPELIDDGDATSPSKRILKEIPEYDKVSSGLIVTRKIGLTALRERCSHFSQWVSDLEQLSQKS